MRASVILAAHDEGSRLSSTLQSVFETCAGLDFEVVLVDDGSTDGSVAEAAQRFSRVRLVTFPERQGPGPAKDRGARDSEGDTLVFLDAHTKPERGAIRRLIEQSERLQGDAILVPQVPALDTERWQNSRRQLGQGYAVDLRTFNTSWKPLRELRPAGSRRAGLYESPALIGCAFAVSRTLYEKLWGQDARMRGWGIEDIDLGLKAWLMGHSVLLDPQATIGHRFRANFDNYQVPMPQVVANQLRMARKNFTETVWTEWIQQARQRFPHASPEYPEGLWARAWLLFEADRASVEEERAYLLGHRVHDEFWYADRFGLTWPTWRSPVAEASLESGAASGGSPEKEAANTPQTPQWMQDWSPERVIREMTLLASPSPSPSPSPPPQPPVPPPCACCPPASSPTSPSGSAGGGGPSGGGSSCSGGTCTARPGMKSGLTLGIAYPVRYENGQIGLIETDLESSGFARPWQHQRSYCNQLSGNSDTGQGYNWLVFNWPYLVDEGSGTMVAVRSTSSSLWFDPSGDDYVARHGEKATLTHDLTNHLFVVTLLDGTQQFYYDFSDNELPGGRFIRQVEPGGAVTEATGYTDDDQISQILRSGTVGGQTLQETYDYAYNEQARVTEIVLRRRLGGGSWENVRRALYEYYADSESFGSEGDLKRVRRQVPAVSGWTDDEILYYRYYTAEESDGFVHGLKFVVQPATYNRMLSESVDPLTASNSTLATYADLYFLYDDQQRVTREWIDGSSRSFEFAYTEGTESSNYNVWKTKTVVIQPDGTEQIVYTNLLGQGIVYELKSGDERWISAAQYDSKGRIVSFAHPSAVLTYDDSSPTLAIELRPSDGLIDLTEYYTTTGGGAAAGYVSAKKLKQGTGGTPVLLRTIEYASQSAGGATVYNVSKRTEYQNDNGTGAIETTVAFTFYSGATQVQQSTTTLPVVPTTQNGSGVAATRKEYFDTDGRPTWSMDERGFITNRTYDLATGALVQQVDDVDTSTASGVPSGWSTPSGGGLNLVTDMLVDDQGRMTQSLGPSHSIDLVGTATTIRRATWIVYDDANHITYAGQGYATGTSPSYSYTLENPVSITKLDAGGKVLEQIQATAASTSGTLASIITAAGGGAAAFPQTSYTRWTTNQYTDCCLAASMRVYHTIPVSGEGTSGTNYDETDFGYDVMKRRNRTVTPGGTITYQVYDARGLVSSTWIGTNDNGTTDQDPSGGGASGNNMVIVTENVYDGGADGGDGNLTQQTQYASASDTRVTSFAYDFRDRKVTTEGEVDYFEKLYYDNLGHVVKSERYDTTSGGNLIARSETKFDPRGQTYQRIRYGVEPSTGTVGNSLTDDAWYDAAGNVLKSLPAGSGLFTKTVYDSLGRTTTQYVGYDTAETSYSDAGSVTDDVILEQNETSYDSAGNVLQTTSRQRYHNVPDTQLGPLGDPSTTPKARVTYTAQWADPLGRTVAAANYGTNGGSALSRPSTIPSRSDTVLVLSTIYDSAGNVESSTDPAGMVTRLEYDDRGRETAKILNPTSSSSSSSSSSGGCSSSDDENVTINTEYDADSNVFKLTAVNSATGNQTTTYVHGTTLTDSEIATSVLKRKEIYPDSTGDSDAIAFAYNRQQQVILATDQAGTVHAYDYDKLGRQTQDRITTLGSGVDGAVRRIATTYEVRGMKAKLTSYDNPTVGSGTVVNDVQFAYNDFGQLTTDYQSHSGAVNVSTTPKVQYGYADGATNTIRPTTLTYPNGRVLTFSYGAGSISDRSSRIASIVDDDSTHLVDYDYLGRGTFVIADDPEPDVKWTLADLSGSNDPDTGDIYSGLDRFGRVKDNRWYDYGSSTDVDRIKYGYDRAGNRIWRENTVATSLSKEFDELYGNDAIYRLQDMQRGTLNSGHTALTSETFAQCWTLDATGNWSGFRADDTGDGTWDLVQARTANTVNEITDITNSVGTAWVDPAYSPAGNMATMPRSNDPTQSYTATYDAWNRLVKLAAGASTVSEYAYDGAERRVIQKTYSGGSLSETRHLYYTQPSHWQVIEERVDPSSNAQRQFVRGLRFIDDCVLRDRDTTGNGTLDERLYACQDVNWNVDAIIDTTGNVQERFAYSAYGVPLFLTSGFGSRSASSYDWEYLYCGYRYETGTGVFHVRYRVYLTPLGTWTRRDPVGYNPAGPNLYQYAISRPLSLTDPLGLSPLDDMIDDFLEVLDTWTIQQAQTACAAWIARDTARVGDDWLDQLPDCPCTEDAAKDPKSAWSSDAAPDTHFHPNADSCYRQSSRPYKFGQRLPTGQQCCYKDGQLITAGPSAGTPDYTSTDVPVNALPGAAGQHFRNDVMPFLICQKGGMLDYYLLQRPPNPGKDAAGAPCPWFNPDEC